MLSELFIKTVYAFLLLCFTFCLILHLSKIQKRIVYKKTVSPIVISEIFLFTPIFFLLLGLTKKTIAATFLQDFNYLYTNQLIQLIGLAVIICGLIIYIWALIVYVAEKKVLIPTRGPYLFSRNPISLGFIIMETGIVLVKPYLSILLWFATSILVLLLILTIKENFLVSAIGPKYQTHMRLKSKIMPLFTRKKVVPVALFASGAGSNIKAIITSQNQSTRLTVSYPCLISNNSKSGALDLGKSLGLYCYHISSFTHPERLELVEKFYKILKKHQIELIVLAGYMKKLPAEFIKKWEGRVMNIHPSLLPLYGGRGMYGLAPHRAVIASGDNETGITIHWVNEEFDSGSPILQKTIKVFPNESPEALSIRIKTLEHTLYWKTINQVAKNISAGIEPYNK